ncbi:MAG: quinone-dependent dihydroorotate dehydrogenase [Chitinophagaceae bacterium]|nr:quinone-dependent dihydroorotate dehydrogenase [Chitinophagaceae bacterium]
MYKLLRNILFLFDPEQVHYFSMNFMRFFCKIPFANNWLSKQYAADIIQLEKKVFGLTFKNPVGLGAGFDKNAKYLSELEALGFGFIEIGTVTPLPQNGNNKPRLFRLPKDKALINRMGFNNDGVVLVAKRLREWRETASGEKRVASSEKQIASSSKRVASRKLIIGGNIGKNKSTPNDEAWKDYETCFRGLFDHVDYFVVNVSSPNTPGLRELQQKDSLKKILLNLQNINEEYKDGCKPILLKISPDLEREAIKDIIELCTEINLEGLVVSNTTISRENLQTPNNELQKTGDGGLSGKPLINKSNDLVKFIHGLNNGLIIIGSGGIFTGDDAIEKINSGCTLLQVWTGFIYEGPAIIKKICRTLINNH